MYAPAESPRDASQTAVLALRATGISPDLSKPVESLAHKAGAQVFRMCCRGGQPMSVVVKRAACVEIDAESQCYEFVLARLPVRTAEYYGAFEDGGQRWLVLEDVGDREPAMDHKGCARRLAQWFASAHRAASSLSDMPTLPARGPAYFRTRLERAKADLERRLGIAVDRRERTIFGHALEALDAVAAIWPTITRACDGLPSTLVHGDIAAQNLRVIDVDDDSKLAVIDWEKAGWGVPALDLARLDLSEYKAAGGIKWLACSREQAEMVAWAGRIFRVFLHNHAAKSPTRIKVYTHKLLATLEDAR